MSTPPTSGDPVAILGELIANIKVAMLTSLGSDGHLHSRPMTTQEFAFTGELWFFAARSSLVRWEIARHPQVNLAYAAHGDHRYVSVSGHAQLVEDRGKAERLWSPSYKLWFPEGLDDPNLALIKVAVEHAEYWDAPRGVMVKVAGFLKALVGGKPAGGERGSLDLPAGTAAGS